MLLDHLPGGQYHSVTDERLTNSVPTINVAPERDFVVFDRLLREKSHATSIALESLILFSHNKTANWIEQKVSNDKKKN